MSQAKQHPRISAENLCLGGGGQFERAQGLENRLWLDPWMIAGEEQFVFAAEIEREAHRLRQGRDDVEVDQPEIFAGRAGEVPRAAFEHRHLVVHPADDVGQRAAEVRADELELRQLVRRTLAMRRVRAMVLSNMLPSVLVIS